MRSFGPARGMAAGHGGPHRPVARAGTPLAPNDPVANDAAGVAAYRANRIEDVERTTQALLREERTLGSEGTDP